MFISLRYSGYNRHGEQSAAGLFLLVAQDPHSTALRPELRAVVRYVRFRQLGAWMMGSARVGAQRRMGLSGSYGSDGLPIDLTRYSAADEIWARFKPIPQELQDAFWAGGGHNCAGSEGPAFKAWARENLATLRK